MILNWTSVKNEFSKSPNHIQVFEKEILDTDPQRNMLEIVVHNNSLIVVNHYLRILCNGNTEYDNIYSFNASFKKIIGEGIYAVAHDVFGGIFAITERGISYFSPDTLAWEDLHISYDGFITWISQNNINDFYEPFLWEGFDDFIRKVEPCEGVFIYPFLWSKECSIDTASKKIVPFGDVLKTQSEFQKEFDK